MFCALILGFALAGTSAAPEVYELVQSPPPKFNVASCRLKLKPDTRTAEFAAVVHYGLHTNAEGGVTSVVEDGASGSPPPFRPEFDSLERCLKSWKLEADTEYTAELHWGSTLPKPTWQVCRTSGGCVQLVEAP
jgi:hypothetical protein